MTASDQQAAGQVPLWPLALREPVQKESRMTGTVLITGCSSGFGEAAAKLFASRGWTVVATKRSVDRGQGLPI